MLAMAWRRASAVAAAGCALLLGGCTGEDAAPTASEPTGGAQLTATAAATAGGHAEAALTAPDPCGLISPDELRAATGFAFSDGEAAAGLPDERRGCTWFTADVPAQLDVMLSAIDSAAEREYWSGINVDTVDADVAGATDAWTMWDGTYLGMQVDDVYVEVVYNWQPEGFVPPPITDVGVVVVGHM